MWSKTPELEIVQSFPLQIFVHTFLLLLNNLIYCLSHSRIKASIGIHVYCYILFDLEGGGCHFVRSSG